MEHAEQDHPGEAVASLYGYKNFEGATPYSLTNFHSPHLLLASLLERLEAVTANYTIQSSRCSYEYGAQHYIIFLGSQVIGYCGPAGGGESGYTGFVHIEG